MSDLQKTLGRTGQSADSPPGADVAESDLTKDDIRQRGDFRRTAIPAGMEPTRKSESQGEPYSKPYRISQVYEVSPANVGFTGAQFTAVVGEGNGRFSAPLDFEAHSLIVDNWSNQYVYFPAANRWVAPYQIDKILVVPRGTTTLELKFIPPSSVIALPNLTSGHFVSVQAYEGMLTPTAGTDVTGLIGVAGLATNVNVALWNGLAPLPASGDADAMTTWTGPLTLALGFLFNGATKDRARSLSAVADGLGVALASQPSSTASAATATAGIATVTFANVAGQQHRITTVAAGYTAVASTAATSTVTLSDGTTILVYDVANDITGGNRPINLPPGGIKFPVNTTVTATLVSGVAAGSVGNVNASKLTA